MKFPNEPFSDYFDIYVDPLNLYRWYITFYGPKDTGYEKGVFKMEIFVPEHYPFRPP